MLHILLLAVFTRSSWTYGGYDSGGGTPNSCGRPYRAGRMHKPPCNLAHEGGFCKDAGDNYPWGAVKRFVKENRGLMRRMYGEQPEGSLLREELARMSSEPLRDRFPRQHQLVDIDNELYRDDETDEYEDGLFQAENYVKQEYELKFEGRYMRDEDVLRTKFIYSEEPAISIKLAGLKTAQHFRRASTTDSITINTPSKDTTSTSTTSTSSTSSTSFPEATTNSGISSTTTTSETNLPSDISQNDLDNSTKPSLREADEVMEVTTYYESDATSTSVETEKTAKSTLPSTSMTTEKMEDPTTSTENPTSSSKPNANAGVLFQDMVDDTTEKVKLNYKLAGVNACPVKEEVVAPFWANNTRGEVLALLNMYPFEQYVHWEKCTFENKQMYCREGCKCEQQYRLHRLLAYDPQNECKGIFSDWFRFPSCCVCKCYGLPSEFRVTSRSPRNGEEMWMNI